MYFANCHTLVDKSESIYVFKMEIDDSWLEADYDEIRHESVSKEELSRYNSDLEYTLMQFKVLIQTFKQYEINEVHTNDDEPDNSDILSEFLSATQRLRK